MKIIAFSGKKQSGKTTAVNGIVERLGQNVSVDALCFADYLKEIVANCFGADFDSLNGTDEEKNTILPCGKSSREILQIVGTDWFRSIEPDCWVNAYKCRLEYYPVDLLLTPDVRFPNEVACVQSLGGHVIRLLRAPFPDDKHESETALDEMALKHNGISCRLSPDHTEIEMAECGYIKCKNGFDAMIDNSDMTIEQQNGAVWKLVKEQGWI